MRERQCEAALAACERGTAASCRLRSRGCAPSRPGRANARAAGRARSGAPPRWAMPRACRNASSVRRRPDTLRARRQPCVDLRDGMAALQSNAIERPSTVSAGRPRSAVSARLRRTSSRTDASAAPRIAGEGSIDTTPSSPSSTSRLPSSTPHHAGSERHRHRHARATARRWPRARSRSPPRAQRRRCSRAPSSSSATSAGPSSRATRIDVAGRQRRHARPVRRCRAARRPSSRTSAARAASERVGELGEEIGRTRSQPASTAAAGDSCAPSSRTRASREGSSAINRFASRISASSARPARTQCSRGSAELDRRLRKG